MPSLPVEYRVYTSSVRGLQGRPFKVYVLGTCHHLGEFRTRNSPCVLFERFIGRGDTRNTGPRSASAKYRAEAEELVAELTANQPRIEVSEDTIRKATALRLRGGVSRDAA